MITLMPLNGNSLRVDEETGFLEPSSNYSLTGFTADKKKLAIEMLSEKLNVGAVCKAIGVSREHFYLIMQKDKAFAKAYKEVKEAHLDSIVDNMYDRAKKPNGTVAGIFLLKTQRPHEYQDKTIIEHQSKTPIEQMFSQLEQQGKIINVESAKNNDDTISSDKPISESPSTSSSK